MITLTTTKAKLLFVEVPDDARDVEVHDGYITYHVGSGTDKYDILRDRADGINQDTHTFLFTTKQGREEDWKGVVDEFDLLYGIYYPDYDTPYKPHPIPFTTATSSGLSLQQANGMDVNKNYAVIKIG